jgi:hypothetical protein
VPFSLTDTLGMAARNAEVTRQASMVAYVDDFRLIMLIALFFPAATAASARGAPPSGDSGRGRLSYLVWFRTLARRRQQHCCSDRGEYSFNHGKFSRCINIRVVYDRISAINYLMTRAIKLANIGASALPAIRPVALRL